LIPWNRFLGSLKFKNSSSEYFSSLGKVPDDGRVQEEADRLPATDRQNVRHISHQQQGQS
jgi:hypothetical protein